MKRVFRSRIAEGLADDSSEAACTRSRRARHIALAGSLVLTGLLLSVIMLQTEWHVLTDRLRGSNLYHVALGCGLGVAYQVLRGARFAQLLAIGHSTALVATMCLHAVARKLLPVWIGEATGVWLFRRRHGVAAGAGTASLALARTVDLAIVLAAVFSLTAAGTLPPALPQASVALLVVLVLSGLLILMLAARADRGSSSPPAPTAKLACMVRDFASEAAQSIRRARGAAVIVATVLLSVAMWLAMYLQHYMFVLALDFPLSALDVLWIQIVLVPIQLLPIRGVADLGTHEAGWFLGATYVGMGKGEAAVLGIATHVLAFVATAVYLFVGVVLMLLERRNRQARRADEQRRTTDL